MRFAISKYQNSYLPINSQAILSQFSEILVVTAQRLLKKLNIFPQDLKESETSSKNPEVMPWKSSIGWPDPSELVKQEMDAEKVIANFSCRLNSNC